MTVYIFGMETHLLFEEPIWIVSQAFAFLALIFSVWSWQIKEKIRMMVFVGIFSTFLAVSASLLGNFTLGVLFGLAAIRNFVFSGIDWRISKGRYVPKRLPIYFAIIFATATIFSTVLLVHILQVPTYGAWLEWMICATLLGLIIGNILKGTNLMRVSFIANRVFNIINHAYFNNAIAVIIALFAIGSNIVFYIRMLVSWLRARKKNQPNS